MKKQTTYALLVRSEEKGRNILETAVYAVCILSGIFAISQFALQPVSLAMDNLVSPAVAAPQVSQHQPERTAESKS